MFRSVLGPAAAANVPADAAFAAEEEIHGTYRLVSSTQRYLETGEVVTSSADNGFLTYGRDGRMMVIIVGYDRPKPESAEDMTDQARVELYQSLVAYGGTYKFDGKTIEHCVEISWNEMWTGTTQLRDMKRDGERLSISTRPAPNARNGRMAVTTLLWEKVK
jgi:hypothetical protein